MTTLFIILASLLIAVTAAAKLPALTYRYVVKFNSECCGVPNAAPILKCIATFKMKHKIKSVYYYFISPMGREGEYFMAFNLKELTKKQSVLFIKETDITTLKMKEKGNCTTEQNFVIDKESLSPRTTILKKAI